ncbi:MAG TPA: permease-like cell division protein FtsX [Thermodesulfobacteriota bacterium]|nr:permease-like cell division protein FtsX [Thermodesulfobacteriota bacterium]
MGVSGNLPYFITDAFRSIRENLATTVLTSVTLGFSLAIFSIFLIVFMNLNGVVGAWGERAHVVVYVKDSEAKADPETLKKQILSIAGVKDARYISKESAFEELKAGLKGHEGVLEGVDKSVLPASFEVTVSEDYRDPGRMPGLVERLEKFSWAEDVQWGQEWIKKFSGVLRFMEAGALFMGVFLAAATVFIITNTIRLTVYARKEEIEVMRLVGASDVFIKMPFFLEGVIQGVAGGVLALGILLLGRAVLLSGMPAYLTFIVDTPVSVAALLLLLVSSGIVMGVAGSLISMGRFLKV